MDYLPSFLTFTAKETGPRNVTFTTKHFTISLTKNHEDSKLRGELFYQWSLAESLPLPRRNPREWHPDFSSFWEAKELEKVITYLLDLEDVDTLNGIVLAGDFKRAIEVALEATND